MSSGNPRLVNLYFPLSNGRGVSGATTTNCVLVSIQATPPFTPSSLPKITGSMNGDQISFTIESNTPFFSPGLADGLVVGLGYGNISFEGINGATGADILVYNLDQVTYLKKSAASYAFSGRITSRTKLAALSSF